MGKSSLVTALTSISLMIALTGCDQAEPVAPTPFQSITDVHELMTWVIDPAADHIWDSAGTIITAGERRELAPNSDEGWNKVRHSAMVLAEAGNLLLMPDKRKNNDDWAEIARGLTAVSLQAAKAAEAQDADALFDAGGNIYNVCVACHQSYLIKDEA